MKKKALVKGCAVILPLVFVGAACESGPSVDTVTSQQASSTTSMVSSGFEGPGGIQCEPTERASTAHFEYARNSDRSVDLEERAATAAQAVQQYRARWLPNLQGEPAGRSSQTRPGAQEFVFQRDTGRPALVIYAEEAPEGWYVSLHHACSDFETAARGGAR